MSQLCKGEMLAVYKAPFPPSPTINSKVVCPPPTTWQNHALRWFPLHKNRAIEHIVCGSEAESVLAPNFEYQDKK